jgi:uncharacterized protein YjiS (DUF1127 family)
VAEASHRQRGLVLWHALGRVRGLLRLWRRRMRESRELSLMSDRELRDMNVSRYEVEHAARKPFWRV